jgi:hypothetical protein
MATVVKSKPAAARRRHATAIKTVGIGSILSAKKMLLSKKHSANPCGLAKIRRIAAGPSAQPYDSSAFSAPHPNSARNPPLLA